MGIMKIRLFGVIGLILIACIWLTAIFSCSAKFHEKKFIQKGGKFECDPITVTIRDTIKGKDGHDSIITKEIKVPCPDVETPPTRWEVRYKYKFDHKRFQDSVRAFNKRMAAREDFIIDSMRIDKQKAVKLAKQSGKDKNKEDKNENKKNKHSVWSWLAACLVLLILVILLLKYSPR